MIEKAGIVERLGEVAVLLPELLARALAANDRAKLRMTILQDALAHARNPASAPRDLDLERHAAGLEDVTFNASVSGARLLEEDRLMTPGAQRLIAGLKDDLDIMIAPLKAGEPPLSEKLIKRIEALRPELEGVKDDLLPVRLVATITSAGKGNRDTVHRIVMDLHKAINALSAKMAVETIAGAAVYGLADEDRPRIEAFMRGLDRTRGLAFGHPGLGTSATRSGKTLVIQNDIGTTDAHVVLVHVEGLTVTITYTDVHRARAKFFMALFEERHVDWSKPSEERAERLQSGEFLLVTGRYLAANEADLEAFLEFFASRLVFIIDWNKARKALRNFISDNAAKDVLRWTATHDCGHRGLLELGGAEAIYEAVRRVEPARVPYGARLDSVLGSAKTADFLKQAMRVASEGLIAGRSAGLLRDQIQTLLASEFETLESAFLVAVVRHLGLTRMMAAVLESAFSGGHLAPTVDREMLARQTQRLEHKADRLTAETRPMVSRLDDGEGYLRQILNAAEDANDALEEAGFLLSLIPENETGEPVSQFLYPLLEIAKNSIGELVRAVEASSHLQDGRQTDVTDALQAIDAVIDAEKRADDALRSAMAAFVVNVPEARLLFLGTEVARAIETSTDHLSASARALRDRILTKLNA